jgi:hypothetical protein
MCNEPPRPEGRGILLALQKTRGSFCKEIYYTVVFNTMRSKRCHNLTALKGGVFNPTANKSKLDGNVNLSKAALAVRSRGLGVRL